MPALTNSPMSSPSLRTIAHAQMRNSYFPSVPSAVTHSYNHHTGPVPRTPQSSLNVTPNRPAAPLVGCLKHTQRATTQQQQYSTGRPAVTSASPANEYPPTYAQHVGDRAYVSPAMRSINPQEKRRASMGTNFKVSQIPLGPGSNSSFTPNSTRGMHTAVAAHEIDTSSVPGRTQTMDNGARRRPSFKIELPPRPMSNASPQHRPQPHILSNQLVDSPSAQEPTWFANRTPLINGGPAFRDPFAAHSETDQCVGEGQGGYIILRAPSHGAHPSRPGPMATQQPAEEVWPGMVGLGYSLNRLRAPTPWLRDARDSQDEPEEDGEWLRREGMESVEGRLRGLGFA
ncbi:hypothetical protein CI109_101927 [Kwoniella shandongensis]|uniref:Uncharacterized protein n=1 Tax=Kwoniella shandongensis TaxID=1734106 RepID=A0A5M6BZ85_9TREE|nr:uncharacterized protein CI109_005413 [Kwoniella shandongensis]KAA5526289.1 hypothetical protein CI109_005413 [Kwoniella shandongensis]